MSHSTPKPSIRGCLNVLGIIIPSEESTEFFLDCDGDLEKEFTTLKKIYFRKILKEHPDKGGDPNVFRKTRSAFEILREKRINNELFFSFLDEEELIKDENGSERGRRRSGGDDIPFDQDNFFRKEAERAAKQDTNDVPSYEYYYEAAQQAVPGYRVELAKSGRSRCQKCNRDATKMNKNKNKKSTGTKGTGGGEVKKKEDPSPSPPPLRTAAAAAQVEQPTATALALVVAVPTGGRQTRAMTRASRTTVVTSTTPTTTTTAAAATATATVKKATKKTAAATKKKKATAAVTTAITAAAITKYEDTTLIPKDGIRVGSLDEFSGSYGRWHHLPCWRVPYRIWAGLNDPNNKEQVWLDLLSMDEILLTNVSSLVPSKSDTNAIKNGDDDDDDDDNDDDEEVNNNKELFIAHVMDRNNWARKTKSSKPPPDLERLRKEQDEKMNIKMAAATPSEKKRSAPDDDDDDDRKPAAAAASSKGGSKKKKTKKSTKGSSDSTTTTAASTTAMVPVAAAASAVVKKKKATTTRKAFKIPRPGKDGAADSNLYEGKRFVLTGVFPEIGGGIGLDQGKSKVKSLVESFGGRVTSAVSGVTDYLIVGRNPGASKVGKAISKDVPRIDLKSLGENIYNTIPSLEQAPTPVITSFSAGYSGRLLKN